MYAESGCIWVIAVDQNLLIHAPHRAARIQVAEEEDKVLGRASARFVKPAHAESQSGKSERSDYVTKWRPGVVTVQSGDRVWLRYKVGTGCGYVTKWGPGVVAVQSGNRVWLRCKVGTGCGYITKWGPGVDTLQTENQVWLRYKERVKHSGYTVHGYIK